MTDGAKKEQKKALKEIKTTIHNTGSRLAAAGTAVASASKAERRIQRRSEQAATQEKRCHRPQRR